MTAPNRPTAALDVAIVIFGLLGAMLGLTVLIRLFLGHHALQTHGGHILLLAAPLIFFALVVSDQYELTRRHSTLVRVGLALIIGLLILQIVNPFHLQ